MIILLTGATGFIGRTLAARLAADGHALRALSRNPEVTPGVLPPACAIFRWDGRGPVPPAALDGVEGVAHLAGEGIAGGRWTESRKARIRDSRVAMTRALVDSLARLKAKPKAFVAASAAGYYGDGGDRLLAETDPPGAGFLAEVCRAWEAETARAEALGSRVAALRLGLVLGREGVVGKLAPVYRLGGGAALGSGRQWWSWIHVADAAGLFAHALTDDRVRGPVNAVAGASTQRDFARALARAVHRPAPWRVPAFALKLGLGEMAASLLEGQRASGAKAEASGYRWRYPTLEGALRAALEPGAPTG